MDNCEHCRFWVPETREAKQGTCRYNPPQAFMVMAASRMSPHNPQPQFLCTWPSTHPKARCGKFERGASLPEELASPLSLPPGEEK
jgi:hypothetical protein